MTPSFAVVNRQNGRYDVVHIVRATAASWFDSAGTRWIRDSGLMYGAGNYGAKIVNHHPTPEAAWAEATERTTCAAAEKRDATARRDAHERIRRVVWRSQRHPSTDRLRLIAEMVELLAGDTVDNDKADWILAIARGVA